jgi:hypothetical protein
MGQNVLKETYTITIFKWVIPSKGLVNSNLRKIYLIDKLMTKYTKFYQAQYGILYF